MRNEQQIGWNRGNNSRPYIFKDGGFLFLKFINALNYAFNV